MDQDSELRHAFVASIKSALDDAREYPAKIDNLSLAEMILQRIIGE